MVVGESHHFRTPPMLVSRFGKDFLLERSTPLKRSQRFADSFGPPTTASGQGKRVMVFGSGFFGGGKKKLFPNTLQILRISIKN